MSSFNLMVIIVLLIVIVILLITIISILNKKNSPKSIKKTEHIEEKNVPMPDISGLDLPPNIEKLSLPELHTIAKKIYDSYRCFDYRNMSINDLDKKEWHTWQISILLMIYKKNDDLFIPNQEEVFYNLLVESSSNSIKSIMKDLLDKYENYVDIFSGKDPLSREYIWSNRDASVIFYFLANYKSYKK